jgi:hypothetical protein
MHGFCPPPLASQSFAAALSSFYHPVKVAAVTMVPAAMPATRGIRIVCEQIVAVEPVSFNY